MGAVFKITCDISTPERKEKLSQAIAEIFKLSQLLQESKSKKVKAFLKDCTDEERTWLEVEKDSILVISEGLHYIYLDDPKRYKKICYNFGKEIPAPLAFISAVISIIYHHIPDAEIGRDSCTHDNEYDDGVALARLVNANVTNPFFSDSTRTIKPSAEIQAVCSSLQNPSEEKTEEKIEENEPIATETKIKNKSSGIKRGVGGIKRKREQEEPTSASATELRPPSSPKKPKTDAQSPLPKLATGLPTNPYRSSSLPLPNLDSLPASSSSTAEEPHDHHESKKPLLTPMS